MGSILDQKEKTAFVAELNWFFDTGLDTIFNPVLTKIGWRKTEDDDDGPHFRIEFSDKLGIYIYDTPPSKINILTSYYTQKITELRLDYIRSLLNHHLSEKISKIIVNILDLKTINSVIGFHGMGFCTFSC